MTAGRLPLAARRVFRLGLTVALALTLAYALAQPLPYITPLLALMLTAQPGPPMGPKSMLRAALAVGVILSSGLLLAPVVQHYPFTGLLLVAVGLFGCNYLSVSLGKAAVASLLTAGIAMISAAATVSHALASAVVAALVMSVVTAVICQWLVYPFFPEDVQPTGVAPEARSTPEQANWIALRATLIVLPAYFIVLINPTMYMPLILKSASLGQQVSGRDARREGVEVLASTFLGGCFAVVLWFALSLAVNLWMFFLWMALFGVYYGSKLYGVLPSRYPPSFWINTVVTMLIMLGPAVQDSANGKDVYAAFAVRFALFVVVTVYAWSAVVLLDRWRRRRRLDDPPMSLATEPN